MTGITIDQLNSNTWPHEAVENRLRALAINAVREARVIFARDDKPFLDDDARRVEMIFQLLHLATEDQIIRENEHFPLVSVVQAVKNERLERAERILSESSERAERAAKKLASS